MEKVCEQEVGSINDVLHELPPILDKFNDNDMNETERLEQELSNIVEENDKSNSEEICEDNLNRMDLESKPPKVLNIKSCLNKTDMKSDGKSSNLDERLRQIIWNCRKSKLPFFFCLNKFKLGKACRKKNSSISIMAIVNVEGLEREYKALIEDCQAQRIKFYRESNKEEYLDNVFVDLEEFDRAKAINHETEE
eukprot:CAMPEP_0170538864 /NCGR_PEP_ID=MMETSP0209-20121228/103574_1 /TAXON_ID=665100 ORGANISM="Litonotus pictus, Strain P1" /NCGR_SAMPLE_ID=MMETSP0209 /ASSEMBLY_ACC=CAM_ASM_000301 /LENGTH=193 /DNA_ID=CAMNT_0010840655 /DNA_START=2545 /DNA_END=3123 /DNA_ORIENTATION=-